MVPRRLRSWKDLKNFLGVLNFIYVPAGELEKNAKQTKSSNNLTPAWELLGYCNSLSHGRHRCGLFTLSGRPKEQKGISVCRQGKELHRRLLSGFVSISHFNPLLDIFQASEGGFSET